MKLRKLIVTGIAVLLTTVFVSAAKAQPPAADRLEKAKKRELAAPENVKKKLQTMRADIKKKGLKFL